MTTRRKSPKPRVFISHSHRDRHSATDRQAVLMQHGADTYLDQDKIQAGDVLPDRIQEGITWCDTFLLIWSTQAASSEWVRREWEMAYDSKKKIIPYVLDRTPLPSTLENLVYVDLRDRELGDSQLLTAVFGRDFRPPPWTLFPGHWRASVNIGGMMEATYDLELRENGQVEGEGGLSQSGFMPQGVGDLMKMRIPFHGSWSYDQGTKMLTIETVVTIMGRNDRETIRIHTTGREKGAISGPDLGGRMWTLWRVGERVPSEVEDPKRQHYRESVQNIYDQFKNSNMLGVMLAGLCLGIQGDIGVDLGLSDELLFRNMRAEKGALEDLVSQLKRGGWLK